MEQELNKRLSIITAKETQKQQLDYEIELIKTDCVKLFKLKNDIDICQLVDFHEVWRTQPKKIKNKKYTFKNVKNSYDTFMLLTQTMIFQDIIDQVKFHEKLRILGWDDVAIILPFEYNGINFELSLPNIQNIDSFDGMIYNGYYQLTRKETDTLGINFAKCYSCTELKDHIRALLDMEVSECKKKI